MQVELVRATAQDAEALAHIQNQALFEDFCRCGSYPGYDEPIAALAEAATTKHAFKIVIADRLVGDVIARADGNGLYTLESFCIAPQHEHRGIGRRALALMERSLPDVERIVLRMPAFKRRALVFCGKSGYRQIGRESENGITWLTLEKQVAHALPDSASEFATQLVCIGALPCNGNGEVLLIKRDSKVWSFPMGILERAETLEAAVARIVRQQCGLIANPDELAAVYSVLPNVAAIQGDPGAIPEYAFQNGALVMDFNCACRSSDITLSEHVSEANWFSKSMARLVIGHGDIYKRLDTLLDCDGHTTLYGALP